MVGLTYISHVHCVIYIMGSSCTAYIVQHGWCHLWSRILQEGVQVARRCLRQVPGWTREGRLHATPYGLILDTEPGFNFAHQTQHWGSGEWGRGWPCARASGQAILDETQCGRLEHWEANPHSDAGGDISKRVFPTTMTSQIEEFPWCVHQPCMLMGTGPFEKKSQM